MSSITDEVIGNAPGGVKKTAELTFRASKNIRKGFRCCQGDLPGISYWHGVYHRRSYESREEKCV